MSSHVYQNISWLKIWTAIFEIFIMFINFHDLTGFRKVLKNGSFYPFLLFNEENSYVLFHISVYSFALQGLQQQMVSLIGGFRRFSSTCDLSVLCQNWFWAEKKSFIWICNGGKMRKSMPFKNICLESYTPHSSRFFRSCCFTLLTLWIT
jgi:hypothetical protein